MQLMCTRRNGIKCVQAWKTMEVDSRMNATRLVNNFGQSYVQFSVIEKRLGSSSLDALTLTVKVLVLPHDRWLSDWMQNTIIKQISQRLLKNRTIMMKFSDLKQKSVKQHMVNVSKWLPSLTIPADEVPCTCCSLRRILNLEEKSVFRD